MFQQHHLPDGQFRFRPVGPLGAGGFGAVERIRITASNNSRLTVGSEWALKRLNESWRQHPEALARFNREIVALKNMSHGNVMSVVGENLTDSSERFYVMPFYPFTLRTLIDRGWKRGDWRTIAYIGGQVASALSHAHLRGFRHRDLKPENIMISNQGHPVVADWGLGYFVHKHSVVLHDLTVGGMGTMYYCSLEQWNTGKCDDRGDVYSLGMTLDEWATGAKRPIRIGEGVAGPSVAPVSAGARHFNKCIQRMAATLPSRRFSTMYEVEQALRTALTLG